MSITKPFSNEIKGFGWKANIMFFFSCSYVLSFRTLWVLIMFLVYRWQVDKSELTHRNIPNLAKIDLEMTWKGKNSNEIWSQFWYRIEKICMRFADCFRTFPLAFVYGETRVISTARGYERTEFWFTLFSWLHSSHIAYFVMHGWSELRQRVTARDPDSLFLIRTHCFMCRS